MKLIILQEEIVSSSVFWQDSLSQKCLDQIWDFNI